MAISNAQIAQEISELVSYWRARDVEFSAWMNGVADGGPYSDGRYGLTDYMGSTKYVHCPAALEAGVSVSSTAAAGSAEAALASANDAAASAAEVAAAVLTALAHKNAAQAAKVAAETARSNAESHMANANVHRTKAKAWASAEPGVVVEDGLFSARHYAEVATTGLDDLDTAVTAAEASAAAAAGSESAAAGSATAAGNAQVAAEVAQEAAEDAQAGVAADAAAAASSASAAASSASAAATSKTNAATSESNASGSASAAAGSASAAAGSASAAAGSASAASTSATNANTSAGNASASAAAAAASALAASVFDPALYFRKDGSVTATGTIKIAPGVNAGIRGGRYNAGNPWFFISSNMTNESTGIAFEVSDGTTTKNTWRLGPTGSLEAVADTYAHIKGRRYDASTPWFYIAANDIATGPTGIRIQTNNGSTVFNALDLDGNGAANFCARLNIATAADGQSAGVWYNNMDGGRSFVGNYSTSSTVKWGVYIVPGGGGAGAWRWVFDQNGALESLNGGQYLKFNHGNNVEPNSGKIGAGLFAGGLNIVGIGTATYNGPREVRLWGDTYWEEGVPRATTWYNRDATRYLDFTTPTYGSARIAGYNNDYAGLHVVSNNGMTLMSHSWQNVGGLYMATLGRWAFYDDNSYFRINRKAITENGYPYFVGNAGTDAAGGAVYVQSFGASGAPSGSGDLWIQYS